MYYYKTPPDSPRDGVLEVLGNAEDRVGRVVREAVRARARREPDLRHVNDEDKPERVGDRSTTLGGRPRWRLPQVSDKGEIMSSLSVLARKSRKRTKIDPPAAPHAMHEGQGTEPSSTRSHVVCRGASLWDLYLRVRLEHPPVQIVGDLSAVLYLRNHVLEGWPTGWTD